MKCDNCGKKVFKRIYDGDRLTRMRMCVNCNMISIAGYPPNKGDKRKTKK